MNYLVHLYLSDPDPLVRIGNLMGDFFKGPLEDAPYPAGIIRGLRQHRDLDSYCLKSPAVKISRNRIDPSFGYFRSIMVDVFYDHFLAGNWSRHADGSLEDFAQSIYRLLEEYEAILPDGLKKIGSFTSPERAVRAAAGIQQSLADYRKKNKRFKLEIRIGLHTGKALVEKRDVFGDTVNVAARIEGLAGAGEILISGSTEKKVQRSEFALTKKTSFIPKGKKTEIVAFKCDWRKLPSQIEGVNYNAVLPMLRRRRSEMLVYVMAILAMSYYMVRNYLRYLLADQENVYLLSVSPQQIVVDHPVLVALMLIGAITIFFLLKHMMVVPVFLFRTIKGGFGYGLAFSVTLAILTLLPVSYSMDRDKVLSESRHLFVEVLQDEARIREEASLSAKIVKMANARDLLLLADVRDDGKMVWNKVLIGAGEYGWIARAIPLVWSRRATIDHCEQVLF